MIEDCENVWVDFAEAIDAVVGDLSQLEPDWQIEMMRRLLAVTTALREEIHQMVQQES